MSAEWSAKSEMQRESEKRQVQKASAERQVQGECRKTSADREPTTHSNTLGGSDHVRIHGLPPLPPTSGFVFMCYCVCLFGFMRLWVCGVVSLWVCGLVFCGFVCVCVFTCFCLFGRCVFLCDHV